ncbi:MAG: fumarylacetoacetate hydrolase family protein [Caulobacterales bacterium]
MKYAVSPRKIIAAAVAGSDLLFPINRIFCVARNYAAHAREMGMDEREPPFFFCKDADAYAPAGSIIPYPSQTSDYQHEVELVVAIGKAGFEISPESAVQHIFGYAVGLDMTRRDLQAAARQKGRPWCEAKNFPSSAPMGPITPIAQCGEINNGAIALSVNGAVRQSSDSALMIWSVSETISHLSKTYTLAPGDLIFTGTPERVGPVIPGDTLTASFESLGEIQFTVGPRA